jgi:hypothetical protein
MNRLLLILALCLPMLAQAEDRRPELTPQHKLVLAEAATALVLGPIVLPVAIITGQQEELCRAMRTTVRTCYNPNNRGEDQCPCGNWLRVIPIVRDFIQPKD